MNLDKWNENVEKARLLISDRKRNQLAVATLALEVCEITWGGSGHRDGRTLKDFANETGIKYKTLSSWIGTKVNIYDKLKGDLKAKAKWSDLTVASRICGVEASPTEVQKKVGEIVYGSATDTRILKYLQTMRSIYRNMQNESAVLLCKKETLQEIKWFAEQIIAEIDRNASERIEAEDHGLCSVYSPSTTGSGAAVSLGLSRAWRLKEKDHAILNAMKKNKLCGSAADIGAVAFKEDNKNTAKLRAMRSLTKLVTMGRVVREGTKYRLKYQRDL